MGILELPVDHHAMFAKTAFVHHFIMIRADFKILLLKGMIISLLVLSNKLKSCTLSVTGPLNKSKAFEASSFSKI